MIYICADDYGLCTSVSDRIQECIDMGAIDKVSVFPNMDPIDWNRIVKNHKIRVALHVNLVEGMCMTEPGQIPMLADEAGRFRHTFFGLFCLSLFHGKAFEKQVYREIQTQVRFWKSILPPEEPFCIDSHQHVHMIPTVFHALLRVLKDEGIQVNHLRIPAEPVLPYLQTPSLYLTYSPKNLIKQWLLNFLWLFNRKQAEKSHIPTAHFMGILFSGHMDQSRVARVLPKYSRLAEKDGKRVEVLFHPGYIENEELDFQKKHVVFDKFYLSKHRKTEFDSVMKHQKEGFSNALH